MLGERNKTLKVTVSFHLYDFIEKAKLQCQRIDQWLLGDGGWGGAWGLTM